MTPARARTARRRLPPAFAALSAAFLLSFCLAPASSARAGELYELYQGARAQAMANAFTAIADDEQAVFLNPAGLAGNKRYVFNVLLSDTSVSSDVIYGYLDGSLQGVLKNPNGADMAKVVMGKNFLAREQLSSILLMPNMGVGIIVDGQGSLEMQNRVLPRATLGYQTTNGIQFGYGVSLGRSLRKRHEVRLGIAGKMLWRRGGYHVLPTLTLFNMTPSMLNLITGPFGVGYGVDLGAQYLFYINKNFTLQSGLVYDDVGDTSFAGGFAQPIKGNLAGGLALNYSFGKARTTLSYDYRHIMAQTDWRKKNHLGLEVALPFLSLYGGINQVYLTYGAAVDIWLFRLTAYSYAEELGSFVYQNPERRYALRASLKFNL